MEISWVYPLKQSPPTTVKFLSQEWADLVAYARTECLRLDLICDMTFGTLWPFGGSFVSDAMGSRTYKGLSEQQLWDSWEAAYLHTPGRILNHLDRKALEEYADIMLQALQPSLVLPFEFADASSEEPEEQESGRFQNIPALFCDSWEVTPEGLWTEGFGEAFYQRFGYHIEAYMDELDAHSAERYDYRVLRAEYILNEFFRPFTAICHRQGVFSRVQAHGAPTDLLAAYATADIPESEALLFDPESTYIAASAAALTGQPVVTCETFTCLYGWKPRPERGQFLKQEKTSDLKLLADALFACGVNHIIWHGMPYNPADSGNEFYASVHVGPDGSIAKDLPGFNRYLETVSQSMKTGSPLTELAVYLPLEDMFMQGELPPDMKKPSSQYYWEMHDLRWPTELDGHHPTWVSTPFLQRASVRKDSAGSYKQDPPFSIQIEEAKFSALVVNARWLAFEALAAIVRLAQEGARILLTTTPSEPGRIPHTGYLELLETLLSLPNISTGPEALSASTLGQACSPILLSLDEEPLPLYRIRRSENSLLCFFAHPSAHGLTYPMSYGYAQSLPRIVRRVGLRIDPLPVGQATKPEQSLYLELTLDFASNQSLLVEIDTSTAEAGYRYRDIAYIPSS